MNLGIFLWGKLIFLIFLLLFFGGLSVSDPLKMGLLIIFSLLLLGIYLMNWLGFLMIFLIYMIFISGLFLILVYCTSLSFEKKGYFSILSLFFLIFSLKLNFYFSSSFIKVLLMLNYFNLMLIIIFFMLLLLFLNIMLFFQGALRSL